jgi:hypothetical protein
MNPYLMTITFLTLLGLVTSSEMVRFRTTSIEQKYYTEVCMQEEQTEELRALSRLDDLRHAGSQTPTGKDSSQDSFEPTPPMSEKKSSKRVRALGVHAARPPNNGRLNFYTLLHQEPAEKAPEEFSLYEVAARLLRILYEKEPICQKTIDFEYLLLNRLIDKKQQTSSFTTPDELSTLDLEDERLQNILTTILKGTALSPSLLNHITFDKIESHRVQNRKINLLFADPHLIQAIFPEREIANQLSLRLQAIWDEIEYQESQRSTLKADEAYGRRDFSDEIKDVLRETLSTAGLNPDRYESHVFDCTLGKPGTVLFVEDQLTHNLIRQKYCPKNKAHPDEQKN